MSSSNTKAKNSANDSESSTVGDNSCCESEFEPHDLRKFQIVATLQNKRNEKLVALHGRFGSVSPNNDTDVLNDNDAVMLLEKAAFSSDLPDLNHVSHITPAELHPIMKNDVYYRYRVSPGPAAASLTQMQMSIIHPCTQRHIDKYSAQHLCVIEETGEEHIAVTRPHIVENQLRLDWVYNALEKRAEVDLNVCDDPHPETGFLLQRDYKWDGTQLTELYCLALVYRRDLLSIRDLRYRHLPLLRNIRDQGAAAIERKYGIQSKQLLVSCFDC